MATQAVWSQRVAAWRASGQSAREFCGARGFSVQSLRYWSSRLGRGNATASPVVRVARLVVSDPPRQARPDDSPILVELGAARVCVRAGFDPATLAAVLDAVRGRDGTR